MIYTEHALIPLAKFPTFKILINNNLYITTEGRQSPDSLTTKADNSTQIVPLQKFPFLFIIIIPCTDPIVVKADHSTQISASKTSAIDNVLSRQCTNTIQHTPSEL